MYSIMMSDAIIDYLKTRNNDCLTLDHLLMVVSYKIEARFTTYFFHLLYFWKLFSDFFVGLFYPISIVFIHFLRIVSLDPE